MTKYKGPSTKYLITNYKLLITNYKVQIANYQLLRVIISFVSFTPFLLHFYSPSKPLVWTYLAGKPTGLLRIGTWLAVRPNSLLMASESIVARGTVARPAAAQ